MDMNELALSWCVRGGARGYVTTAPVNVSIGKSGSGWFLSIAPGREFESSVPRLLRWILSPHDPRFLRAALIHDHLLETGHRPFFAAGEWHAAARADGAGRSFALVAGLGVALVSSVRRWR